jgi:hypothetical protein
MKKFFENPVLDIDFRTEICYNMIMCMMKSFRKKRGMIYELDSGSVSVYRAKPHGIPCGAKKCRGIGAKRLFAAF